MIRNIKSRPRHNSYNYNENYNINSEDDRDVCVKWRKFYEYILIEKYPNATLGTYESSSAKFEENGPKGLFDLSITQCGDGWKVGNDKTMYEALKNPKSAFTKEEDIENPYGALLEIISKFDKQSPDEIACRHFNPQGTYCNIGRMSKTQGRRTAGSLCGVGMLFGVDQVGQCSEYFDYDGLKDDLEDILYITDEFQSLSYLCAGQIISSFQCKLLENFSTQKTIYNNLILKRKELLDYKLYPLKLRVTCVFIITLLVLGFLSLIKSFK